MTSKKPPIDDASYSTTTPLNTTTTLPDSSTPSPNDSLWPPAAESNSILGVYRKGAVASDGAICSTVGK